MTRKTYGRKDVGRVELEGGWFPGEDYRLGAEVLAFRRGYLCLVYLQVAKLCLSVGIRLGDKKEERVGTPIVEKKVAPADYIDWSKVPEGYDWVAVSGYPRGRVAMFPGGEGTPLPSDDEYEYEGFHRDHNKQNNNLPPATTCDPDAIIGPLPPWRESLRRRPGSEATE